jgi:hypothetical protein
MPAFVTKTLIRRAARASRRLVRLIWVGIALFGVLDPGFSPRPALADDLPAINCRHGIVFQNTLQGYPIESLGASGYLDERAETWPDLPPAMEYIPVIRLRDLPETLDPVPAWVASHPGVTWLIGDQPDNPANDALTPEAYAARYYRVAILIRQLDPTARLSFGSIAQPSPIRIRYLTRAWDRLISLAGSRAAASALVDVWNIRDFYLDEIPGQVGSAGAGIPPGFENDAGDAYGQVPLNDVYNVTFYGIRIKTFRDWMMEEGEHQKPLWISAYGVWQVSDQIQEIDIARFMKAITIYMEKTVDPITGLSVDDNHLVQRWFWYSLNGPVTDHSGSLYNPDQLDEGQTFIGKYYIEYNNFVQTDIDVLPAGLKVTPLAFHGPQYLADVQLSVSVANAGSDANGLPVKVTLWDADPGIDGKQIGAGELAQPLPGCGTIAAANIILKTVLPFQTHTVFAQVNLVDPLMELILDNNLASYDFVVRPPQIFIPLVAR